MRAGPRAGFALPLAILALVAVGLVLTAGIHLSLRRGADHVTAEQAIAAFYLAETGLNTVFDEWRPPADELRVWGPPEIRGGSTAQGRWEAEVKRVGERLFFVRSTGVVRGEGGTTARRSIGVAARIEPLRPATGGGLTATRPVQLASGSRVGSADLDPPAWAGRICAISSPASEPTAPEGVAEVRWEDFAPLATVRLNGGTLEGIGPRLGPTGCDRDAAGNWGDPLDPDSECGDHFPVVLVTGDARLSAGGTGQGILLVDGDLTVEGPFTFYGMVVVRGDLALDGGPAGAPTVFGAVHVNDSAGAAARLSGSALVQHSRCAVRRAILGNDRMRRIRPIPTRGWVDLAGASL